MAARGWALTIPSVLDFIYVYNNIFTPSECAQICAFLTNSSNWEEHYYGGDATPVFHKNKKEHYILLSQNTHNSVEYGIVKNKIESALQHYHLSLNLKNWNGYTPVRFNKYNEETQCNEHWDANSSINSEHKGFPLLSVVGVLNDNFKGGDFIMFDNHKINLSGGSILIFPSTFIYYHKVTKITKGTRFSFVSWVW